MNGKNEAPKSPPVVAPVKKPYQRPVLTVFGPVHVLTQATGSANGDAGQGMMVSDRALKENIVRIGDHPLGIGLYLFDYKPAYKSAWGSGRQMGVMADEVEAVRPAAVRLHPDGYKVVDYRMLTAPRLHPGVARTLAEPRASKCSTNITGT